MGITIGKAAEAAGVNVETIRFYERRGLIAQPRKPGGQGYRQYPPEIVARIRFIRKGQGLGFSLREIEDLLSLETNLRADCGDVRARAMAKIEDVNRKLVGEPRAHRPPRAGDVPGAIFEAGGEIHHRRLARLQRRPQR